MENKFAYQMNALAPDGEIKGRLDLAANLDSYAGVVDSTQDEPLVAGDPVAIVSGSKKLPHFVKASEGQVIMGFVKWTAKKNSYEAGDAIEVSYSNDVMYMEVGGAVNAGVALNITDIDDVYVGAAAGDGSVIGYSMESADAANQLIRVRITAPVVFAENS